MLGEILWSIIGGAIVGYLGRLLLPGRQNTSALTTVIVGILAATIGGLIAGWLGVGDTNGIDWIRHIIQLALAVLFVWLAARISSNRSRPTGTTGNQVRPTIREAEKSLVVPRAMRGTTTRFRVRHEGQHV